MPSNAEIRFLNQGKELITGALSGFDVVRISKFEVGTTAGFTPSVDDVAVRGTKVFTADYNSVQVRKVDEDTVRYSLTISEAEGTFDIGNIVLFAQNLVDTNAALIMVSLPFAIEKVASEPSAQPFPVPGNRFVINITVNHTLLSTDVQVNVLVPDFANLPAYASNADVVGYDVNPYPQFIVNHDTRVNAPVFVAKGANQAYMSIPFWQNYNSPYFGALHGGHVGDNHADTALPILFGYYYDTNSALYADSIGGKPYTEQYDPTTVIGGLPY